MKTPPSPAPIQDIAAGKAPGTVRADLDRPASIDRLTR
jgi:hypothetical protein